MTTAQPAAPSRRSLRERLFGNPVVLKELRGRMRGARAFIVLFISIVGIELFLVTFIAPAFAAGSISGERERQTYDLLRTTLLSGRALVSGKLIATLSYIFLLLLAAIPLQSVAFLFGGVTEAEIILSFVVLVATTILLGTVGVFFSAITKRTLSASVLSYAVALVSLLVLPVALLVAGPLLNQAVFSTSAVPGWLEAALYYGLGLLIATNPMATLFMTLFLLIDRQAAWVFSLTLQSGQTIQLISPWAPFLLFSLLTALVLSIIAVRRVNRIEEV